MDKKIAVFPDNIFAGVVYALNSFMIRVNRKLAAEGSYAVKIIGLVK